MKQINRSDSVKQRENKQQDAKTPLLQLQYLSQSRTPVINQFKVEEVKDEQTIESYVDMLNQETDIYYLFDSFHSVVNSLKQASEISSIKVTSSSRQNTLDWWKATGSSNAWTGMKNLQQLSDMKESKFSVSYLSKGSQIVNNLKRQIGEMTDDQKFKQNARTISGVPIQILTRQDLIGEGRVLISVYQVQNRYHKCHMGFIVYTPGKELIINKMYIAKWHRKSNNYFTLINELIRHISLTSTKLKIKVNSSQSGLIRHLQNIGFKLGNQYNLFQELKILSLILDSKDLKL